MKMGFILGDLQLFASKVLFYKKSLLTFGLGSHIQKKIFPENLRIKLSDNVVIQKQGASENSGKVVKGTVYKFTNERVKILID